MYQIIVYGSYGVILAPLFGALLAGLLGKALGRKFAHRVAILGVGLSFVLSCFILKQVIWDKVLAGSLNTNWYTWAITGSLNLKIGFLIDELTALMMVVVSFVSLMVHIYTIGYMRDDPGYQRFFSYTALFTFSMLMLVMANNFLQLFFGWEAVGLVSYLLIGFWFKKETAIVAGLKAFLVNRVGDFGFLIGIAAILAVFGSLDYVDIFHKVPEVVAKGEVFSVFPHTAWPVMNVICIALFIGAMGKSAQMPLHVWLPDSMEGPTPISALIHAATMVTAGVFMVARMSPLFEYSEVALSVILVIGSLTCFFMGLLAVVNNDIKRIIAYSTLSQLGYMMCAVGASAYAVGIFHLMTHAFFKALLFLCAGSVIMGMHHEQNIWKMGGLRKWMPITFGTMLIGTFSIIGFPLFSGFYSKDSIIEALALSTLPGSHLAYWVTLSGVFITALYSFRLIFVVFYTAPRMTQDVRQTIKESPMVVWIPLMLLAIPSIMAGAWFIGPLLKGYFGQSLFVLPGHDVLSNLSREYQGFWQMAVHGLSLVPFWLALAGIFFGWLFYIAFPTIPGIIRKMVLPLAKWMDIKYGFDMFYESVIVGFIKKIGWVFWRGGDGLLIDGVAVDGSAHGIARLSQIVRQIQTGYVYHYVFAMIMGLLVFLIWMLWQ